MQTVEKIIRNTESQISNEQPETVILKLYDLGIDSCLKTDRDKVQKVLNELIASLNFDYYDIANSFFGLYSYAINVLNENKFEEVLNILQGLRDAWNGLMHAREGASQSN